MATIWGMWAIFPIVIGRGGGFPRPLRRDMRSVFGKACCMEAYEMRLKDVLMTELLLERAPSKAKLRKRAQWIHPANDSLLSLVGLAEAIRDGCEAQSAGITLFRRAEPVTSEWIVAVGALGDFAGSRFPLRHSLCGVAADLGSTQLFIKPHRYFKWIEHAGVYISEALVTPLLDGNGRRFGTAWTMSHKGARPRFDRTDALRLERIADQISRRLLDMRPIAQADAAKLPNGSASRTGERRINPGVAAHDNILPC